MSNPLGSAHVPTSSARPGRRRLVQVLALSAASAGLVVGSVAPASAQDSATSSVNGNVVVGSVISLTGLDDNFTVSGLPGTTSNIDTVNYKVETNNTAGYIVTATPSLAVLVGTDPNNSDQIPITDLIANDGTTPVSIQPGGTRVHGESDRSIEGGDPLFTDFYVNIPFVNADTYTVTLDYVATTL